MKRRKHREEGALDKFYNANINLATGLQAALAMRPIETLRNLSCQAMNLFRPECRAEFRFFGVIKDTTKIANEKLRLGLP